tara:strand:- start:105 stop:626 length:522 start_codon:yes stop_codon:yes gene_type:complete
MGRKKKVIKLQNLLIEKKINESAGVFKNKDADSYLKELMDMLGKETYKSDKEYGWYDVTLKDPYYVKKLDKVYIIDESIPHSFPADHRDYCYSQYTVPEWKPKDGQHTIDTQLFEDFAKVTGSIIIDGLKGTITARCGDLVANDVTINFVLDVVAGKTEPSRDEYKKRILATR